MNALTPYSAAFTADTNYSYGQGSSTGLPQHLEVFELPNDGLRIKPIQGGSLGYGIGRALRQGFDALCPVISNIFQSVASHLPKIPTVFDLPIASAAEVPRSKEIHKVPAKLKCKITGFNGGSTSSATLTDGTVFVAWPYNSSAIHGRVLFPNGTGLTDEFVIASYPYHYGVYPKASPLQDGNALVTWEFGYPAGADFINGKIISPEGDSVSPEFSLRAAYYNYLPSSTVLANGYGLAVWNTIPYSSSGADWGVYGQTVSQYGAPLNNPFLISQNHTHDASHSYVTYLTTGDAFAAWVYQEQEIHGRIVSSNGTPKTPELIIDNETVDAYAVAVAPLPYGNALVVWLAEDFGGPYYYGKIYSSSGQVLRDTYSISGNADTQDVPSVSSLNNSNVFVTGEEEPNALIGRIVSQKGGLLFGPFPLNQITTYLHATSSAAPLGNNTLVAWIDKSNDISDIYVRVFSPEGKALTKEIKINQK